MRAPYFIFGSVLFFLVFTNNGYSLDSLNYTDPLGKSNFNTPAKVDQHLSQLTYQSVQSSIEWYQLETGIQNLRRRTPSASKFNVEGLAPKMATIDLPKEQLEHIGESVMSQKACQLYRKDACKDLERNLIRGLQESPVRLNVICQ